MRFAVADVDALVFDCDGVILDSNRIKSEAFFDVTVPFGVEYARRFVDYHRRHGGVTRNEKFAYFLDEIVGVPVEGREATLDGLLSAYGEICSASLLSCPLIPGLEGFLERIPARVTAYVVTGGAEAEVRRVLSDRGLARHFACILGSPSSKRENMERLGRAGAFAGRVVYFGDAELDMALAEEFGLDFVFVYGASEWEDGRAACPYPQIADFTELHAA
jgi:beta-phosphoglucomutase-like phosphatase (HAD superfamily)